MDNLTPIERSEIMSRVRSKDTKPELLVRKLVYSLGYRYRLHYWKLPGKPDMVFPMRGKIIFIHGCFWHRHKGCKLARVPKSRQEFWLQKLEENRKRDQRVNKALYRAGWSVMTIWECKLKDLERLTRRIRRFLDEKR